MSKTASVCCLKSRPLWMQAGTWLTTTYDWIDLKKFGKMRVNNKRHFMWTRMTSPVFQSVPVIQKEKILITLGCWRRFVSDCRMNPLCKAATKIVTMHTAWNGEPFSHMPFEENSTASMDVTLHRTPVSAENSDDKCRTPCLLSACCSQMQ